MMVLTFDQAPRHCGWCYGDSASEKAPRWGCMDFEACGDNDQLLFERVLKWARELVAEVVPEAAFFEQIIINQRNPNMPVTFQQFTVWAAIMVACTDAGAKLQMILISKWRKRCLGRANKPKWAPTGDDKWLKEAAKAACLAMSWLIDNEHAAEAALMWDYGCAFADVDYRRKTAARVTRARMNMEKLDNEHGERIAA